MTRLLGSVHEPGVGRGPGAGWRLTPARSEVTLADLHAALAEQTPFDLHPHVPKDLPRGLLDPADGALSSL